MPKSDKIHEVGTWCTLEPYSFVGPFVDICNGTLSAMVETSTFGNVASPKNGEIRVRGVSKMRTSWDPQKL